MDPNGSYSNKVISTESEANGSLSTLPPKLPDAQVTPLPMANTLTSKPNHSGIFENHHEMLPYQAFLSNPISNYLGTSDQMRILSMESPSVTSLLQGDPLAIVHAHLNTIGATNDSPIFEIPTRHVIEGQHNIPCGTLTHDATDGVPTLLAPFMASPHGVREDIIPIGVPNVTTHSVIVHDYTSLPKYTCKICNRTFYSSQAYGGHMSSHSKEKKKAYKVDLPSKPDIS
ncbi:hypothetical protein ZWY2020_032521 [Hordeum vulgare]|nr:hypothetical protein ZWY2020_032521 [Hordeum vulgare]